MLATISAYIFSWMALTWGIYRIFKETGDATNDDAKRAVNTWLDNIEVKQNSLNWANRFKVLFNNLFTERHWSITCFTLSCRASFYASIVLFFLLFVSNHFHVRQELSRVNRGQTTEVSENDLDVLSLESIFQNLNPDGTASYLDSISYDEMEWRKIKMDLVISLVQRQHDVTMIAEAPIDSFASWRWWESMESSMSGNENQPILMASDSLIIKNLQKSKALLSLPRKLLLDSIGEILIMVLLINLLVDFISLYETRVLIDRMEQYNQVLAWGFLLIIDFIVTGLIFFGTVFLIYYPLGFIEMNQFLPLVLETYHNTLSLSSSDNILVIPLLTTYITSLWLYLYAGASLFIKFLTSLSVGTSFLKKYLDIQNKPFRSIGLIVTVFITILYIIGAFYFLFI